MNTQTIQSTIETLEYTKRVIGDENKVLMKPIDESIQALRQTLAQEQEPMKYREECWACGCEECICATKVPGYYESKIKEAVLDEREACAKFCETQRNDTPATGKEFAAAIRARSDNT